MRTCAATCCAAAAPAPKRQTVTVASHEKKYFPFFTYVKEKPWVYNLTLGND